VGSKIFITNTDLLRVTTEQRLRTFLDDHQPATITFVRSGDGVLTLIEASTPEHANKVAASLASSNVSTVPLAVVLGDSSQGHQLAYLYTALKQRELEVNWTNRQW
jgi:hypothetical protein